MNSRYSTKREKLFFEILLKKFDISKGTFLDVGCGHGFFTNLLEMLGHKTYGLDLDTKMITEATKKYDSNFLIGDSTKMPFSNKTFDFILCRGLSVFYNQILDNTFEQKQHLLDLLKDDGVFIYITASNLSGKKTTIHNHKIEDIKSFFSELDYRVSVYFFFAQDIIFKLLGSKSFSFFITKISSILTKMTNHSGYIVCVVEKNNKIKFD